MHIRKLVPTLACGLGMILASGTAGKFSAAVADEKPSAKAADAPKAEETTDVKLKDLTLN